MPVHRDFGSGPVHRRPPGQHPNPASGSHWHHDASLSGAAVPGPGRGPAAEPQVAERKTGNSMVSVTGWRRLCGLPLLVAPVDSVAPLVASLGGQTPASVHDLYKREATCEYSFGFVVSTFRMSGHPHLTRFAVCAASCRPANRSSAVRASPQLSV